MMPHNIAHDLTAALPLLILSGGSLLVLLIEALRISPAPAPALPVGIPLGAPTPRAVRAADAVTLFSIAAAFMSLIIYGGLYTAGEKIFGGMLYADPLARIVSLLIVGGALAAFVMCEESLASEGVQSRIEFHSLYLMSIAGALIFASSAELITLFLGLEIMSMALYCLCGAVISGTAPRVRRSAEAAMKYFLLGSFSSAFLLYGIALIYGLTGSTDLGHIREVAGSINPPVMMLLALGLMLIGLAFKIGAVPFHFWAPDAYTGAPTSITAYMACVIKTAAVVAALRVVWGAFGTQPGQVSLWMWGVWLLAVLTMTVGNLVALRQRNVKRMLAYSSIAHAGYLLVGFLARDTASAMYGGGAAIFYYLVAYTLMTMGAFGVVLALSPAEGDEERVWKGLGYRRPGLALLMSLFLFSLAGIPPGMAGLLGKFYLFGAAIKSDYVGVVIIGVINSAISCYYYLGVVVSMYFRDSEGEDTAPARLNPGLFAVLVLCAVGVVLLGIFPSSVYQAAVAAFSSL
jgi:NADH-quinone oxidoreductase subunit N